MLDNGVHLAPAPGTGCLVFHVSHTIQPRGSDGSRKGLAVLGMGGKEVTQRREELACALAVASMQSRPDVFDDHLVDLCGAPALLEQVFRKCRSRNLGHVLMLSDGQYLSLGQSAKCNAILKCNHDFHLGRSLAGIRGRA